MTALAVTVLTVGLLLYSALSSIATALRRIATAIEELGRDA
jgi:hypothetical protein